MNSLRLRLLGSPRLLCVVAEPKSIDGLMPSNATSGNVKAGEPVHIARRKALSLLAYLAMSDGRVQRTTLATIFWPDASRSRANSYLRRDLAVVKKATGADLIHADRDSIGLALGNELSLDVDLFRTLLRQCTEHGHPQDKVCPRCLPVLDEAVRLYHGDFMQGFSLPDCPEFDEWQFFEGEQLRAEMIGALSRLTQGWCDQNDIETAQRYARQWLSMTPDHEFVHRELMRLYALSGNQAAALRQYTECVRILAAELNTTPDAETDELHANIKAGRISVLQPAAAIEIPGTPDGIVAASDSRRREAESEPVAYTSQSEPKTRSPKHNLPQPLLPLLGREKELRETSQLLTDEPGCRLLTFVGPPGIGKSRLAIEVGTCVLDSFQDGVYIVYLAAIRSADLIVPAIVEAISLHLQGRSDPKIQLINYLREKQVLLILDNFEHLLFKTPELTRSARSEGEQLLLDILSAAAHTRLLVTSQARIHLQQEWVRELDGLTYPSAETIAKRPGDLPHLLTEYSAVQFFMENARRIRADVVQTNTDLAAAAEICRIVEGLPLGIELATSWIRFMSCADIAAGLKHDLAFMDTTLHDVPERHRSLSALFEYSWRHLNEDERDTLRKLSVFEGGFTHDAARQVTGAPLRLLTALIDRSVVRSARSSRYEMHSVLRQFSLRKLREVGDLMNMTQNEHCNYYARFLQAREADLRQLQRREVFAEVANEADNLRAAWDWAVKNRRLEQINISLEGLHYFYYGQGWVKEGEAVFEYAASTLQAVLEETDEDSLRLIFARLLSRQGRFAYRLGRHSQARENMRKSLEIVTSQPIAPGAGARAERAFCLYFLSAVERADGNYAAAEELCRQSLAFYREIGDKTGVAGALKLLGIAAGSAGRYEEAGILLNEALGLFRASDDRRGVANTLSDLGIVADRQGLSEDAERLYAQCLSMRREINDAWGIAASLNNLGYLANRSGNHVRSLELLRESLLLYREIGDQHQIANILSNLGSVLLATGDRVEAESAFAEAISLAWGVGAIPLVLESLTGMASVLAAGDLDERTQALEILELIYRHQATDALTRASVLELLDRLRPRFTPDSGPEPTEQALSSLVALIVDRSTSGHP